MIEDHSIKRNIGFRNTKQFESNKLVNTVFVIHNKTSMCIILRCEELTFFKLSRGIYIGLSALSAKNIWSRLLEKRRTKSFMKLYIFLINGQGRNKNIKIIVF